MLGFFRMLEPYRDEGATVMCIEVIVRDVGVINNLKPHLVTAFDKAGVVSTNADPLKEFNYKKETNHD